AAGQTSTPVNATSAAVSRPATRTRVQAYRRRLLMTLILGGLFGVVAAVVTLSASIVTHDRYSKIVDTGVVSVDAAQDARADLLDNASANADLLAQTDANARATARTRSQQAWTRFKEDLRRSWRNRSDSAQGEFAAFAAADAAETDYAAAIGAMNAAVDANRADDAHTAFLNAYTVLNQRLLPALSSGLQSVKLEDIGVEYASTSSTIRGWLVALLAASGIVAVIAIVALVLTRQMHARLTWEIAAALVLTLLIGGWLGYQLYRADTKAKVLVSDAYDMVAGVRDEVALVSQENALESIAIFDPAGAAGHFGEINDYDLLFNQRLCGVANCSASPPFVTNPQGGGDTIPPSLQIAAIQGQARFGLAQLPLVANVHFPGEASHLEAARQQYRAFLAIDADLRTQIVDSKNPGAAAAENAGKGEQQYTATIQALGLVQNDARTVYNSIWRSVEDAATIGELLAAGELIAAALLARGLWRRRHQLFVSGLA
ncbi:MAG: hypothetical protein ACYDCQ_18125, partial [Dehalococcoidia bacterium]